MNKKWKPGKHSLMRLLLNRDSMRGITLSTLARLEKVSKHYFLRGSSFEALKKIDFILEKGEMLAIMGASGSGKSTLMNILGFLDSVSEGDYFFEGKKVAQLNPDELSHIRNQKVGFVFQSFFL